MIGPDLLAVEHIGAPHARELEFARNVFVHQLGDIENGVAVPCRKGLVILGGFARRLGVDAYYLQCFEQERSQCTQARPGFGGHGQGRVTQAE